MGESLGHRGDIRLMQTKHQQLVSLSWRILEHKLMYYHPNLIALEHWGKLVIPDDIYDVLKNTFLKMSIELNGIESVLAVGTSGIDLEKPSVKLVLRKYGKEDDRIKQYLIHSYLYYILIESVIPDGEYDLLARGLLEDWDTIEHKYKHLVRKTDLRCGTLFNLSEDKYPDEIKTEARLLLIANKGGK